MSGLYITHMQYVVLGASAKVTLRGEILHPTSPRCQIEGKNIMYNTKSSMVKTISGHKKEQSNKLP